MPEVIQPYILIFAGDTVHIPDGTLNYATGQVVTVYRGRHLIESQDPNGSPRIIYSDTLDLPEDNFGVIVWTAPDPSCVEEQFFSNQYPEDHPQHISRVKKIWNHSTDQENETQTATEVR